MNPRSSSPSGRGQGEGFREAPCARCTKHLGISCCEVTDEDKLATLTTADVERITEATGLPARRFVEVEWFSPEQAYDYEERRPLYRGYFHRSQQRLTLQRRDGACVFLERGKGCRLDEQSRPLACRLYPFEVLRGGELALQVERYGSIEEARASNGLGCLAVEEAASFEELLAMFGKSEEELRALASEIRREVRAHSGG